MLRTIPKQQEEPGLFHWSVPAKVWQTPNVTRFHQRRKRFNEASDFLPLEIFDQLSSLARLTLDHQFFWLINRPWPVQTGEKTFKLGNHTFRWDVFIQHTGLLRSFVSSSKKWLIPHVSSQHHHLVMDSHFWMGFQAPTGNLQHFLPTVTAYLRYFHVLTVLRSFVTQVTVTSSIHLPDADLVSGARHVSRSRCVATPRLGLDLKAWDSIGTWFMGLGLVHDFIHNLFENTWLLKGCNGCNWHTACYACFDLGHLVFLTCLQHVGNSDFEAHRTCLVLGSQIFHPKHIKNCRALTVKFSLIRFGIDKLSNGPHPIGNWYR